MIYLFYTTLALTALVFIGTLKAQQAHIKGLKNMYKEASRHAHALQLETLDLRAKLRNAEDAKQTWARVAHEASEDINTLVRVHSGEVSAMQKQIYLAEQFMHRVREQKRRHMQKKREAQRNGN
jgi:regulator of replication initiation timing